MHPRAQEFAAQVAETHDVEIDVTGFDAGTETAAAAAEAIGCAVGQIASSLVFLVDNEPVVVIASGATHVSEERLAALRGAETATLADPETVEEVTGYPVGGVPPLVHEQAAPILFDETLLPYETVWAAAGTAETVFPIAPGRLREMTGGDVASLEG